MKRKPGTALELLDLLDAKDPRFQQDIAEARSRAAVAQAIYDARTAAGLTQGQLAERAGTTQSVIARLEDANYSGHSLRLLRRIGAALGLEVQVTFTRPKPRPRARRSAA